MVKILRCWFLFALTTLVGAGVSAADVTDVNTIEELKGKAAGTYRFHFGDNMMIYGVCNDEYAGASLYLWDGTEGVRVTSLYDGAMKDIVDVSPVGKALTGTVTAVWNPSSNDGCTLLVNTYRDERCSFDAAVGEELPLEPKSVTVSDISKALQDGYSADFAYVKMHGCISYTDYTKYMYDDNGGRIIIDNTCKVVPAEDFDTAFNNMTGTFIGGLIVTRVTDKEGTTVTPLLGVMDGNWFEAEGIQETPEVELDADGIFDNSRGYSIANVTVRGLVLKAGIPAALNMPFAMTENHIRQNFGDEAKLYCMDSSMGNHIAADDEAVFDLHEFVYDANPTEAGSVYVIVPSKDTGELRFDGVTIAEMQQEGYHSFTDWGTFNKIILRGTFSKKGLDGSKCMVYGEDGSLAVPQGDVKGFTGYFEVPSGVINGRGIRVVLNDNKEGSSCDTPITAVIGGENILPKVAGTYYYEIHPDRAGFITVVSEGRELVGGNVKVLGSCDEFDLLTVSENVFAVRFEVVPGGNKRYIICVTKAADTETDEKFTVAAHDYAAGDSFDEPKEIFIGSVSVSDYNGDYYYKLTVDADVNQFLTINAANSAVRPDTHFLLYDVGNPDKVLARDSEKKIDKYEVLPGKSYILKLHNAESRKFNFSVMLEDVSRGETMSCSIEAALGENKLWDNGYDMYYNYTPVATGFLTVDVQRPVTVEFFDSDGYAVAHKVEGTAYSTESHVSVGSKCYIRFSSIDKHTVFTLSEDCASGIGDVTHDRHGVYVSGGRIIAQGDTNVVVYNMNGIKVAEGCGKGGLDVCRGMYVVIVDGKAVKVTVR